MKPSVNFTGHILLRSSPGRLNLLHATPRQTPNEVLLYLLQSLRSPLPYPASFIPRFVVSIRVYQLVATAIKLWALALAPTLKFNP